eukprot:1154279-Pelagomonas_calceolata.AAC.15
MGAGTELASQRSFCQKIGQGSCTLTTCVGQKDRCSPCSAHFAEELGSAVGIRVDLATGVLHERHNVLTQHLAPEVAHQHTTTRRYTSAATG